MAQQQPQGSSFGGALGGGNIPIVMGRNVIPVYPPPPDSNQQQQLTHGVATLAGFELWVSPKPNIYQDGMVNAFVVVRVFEIRFYGCEWRENLLLCQCNSSI
jgi:hypothetical protein